MEGQSVSHSAGSCEAVLCTIVLTQAGRLAGWQDWVMMFSLELPSRVNAVWQSSPWFGRVLSRVVPVVTVTGSRPGNSS